MPPDVKRDEPAKPPTVEGVARQVLGAMVVREPVPPLAWAIARDEQGKPLYLLAVCMGPDLDRFERLLERVRPMMKPVPPDTLQH